MYKSDLSVQRFHLISFSETYLLTYACPALTWSVKGIVCVEDCGKEAEGERTDAKRHVKACVSKTLEPLHRYRRHQTKHQERIR